MTARDTNPREPHPPNGDLGDPAVRFVAEPDGRSTRVELFVDGRSVSRCWIVSLTIRIGDAAVRMDGLGGVGTDLAERRKGYSRRVIEAALRRIDSGDAALTMLYGIPDFYVRFGYVPAGPDHFIRMPAQPRAVLPRGYSARALQAADVAAMCNLYARQIRSEVGAAVRPDQCYVHRRFREAVIEHGPNSGAATGKCSPIHYRDRCRVVAGPDGTARGYAWRADGFWAADLLQREAPECLIIGETVAEDAEAAGALLETCAAWAREVADHTGRSIEHVLLSAPHDGLIGRAAIGRDALLAKKYTRCGGSMARVCDMKRLIHQMAPELRRRLDDAGLRHNDPITFVTGRGTATLAPTNGRDTGRRMVIECRTPWITQAVLGAALPYEVVEGESVHKGRITAEQLQWIRALFPPRCPHMYLPDRY